MKILSTYLPEPRSNLPALINGKQNENGDFNSEREILYKILFDMKKDLNELKKITKYLKTDEKTPEEMTDFSDLFTREEQVYNSNENNFERKTIQNNNDKYSYAEEIVEEETLSIQHNEIELIMKALEKSKGKRKIFSS